MTRSTKKMKRTMETSQGLEGNDVAKVMDLESPRVHEARESSRGVDENGVRSYRDMLQRNNPNL